MTGPDRQVRRSGRISDAIKARLGASARCPKCGEEGDFLAYLSTDVVSVKVSAGGRIGRPWIIGQPQLGNLNLVDLRCGSCGHRGKAPTFQERSDGDDT